MAGLLEATEGDTSVVQDSVSVGYDNDSETPIPVPGPVLTPSLELRPFVSPTEPTVTPLVVEPPAPAQPNAMTNRERLELITKLVNEPLKNGDVWFIIPNLWFNNWKKICEDDPDAIDTKVKPISTSMLVDNSGQLVHNNTLESYIPYTDPLDPSHRSNFISLKPRRKLIPAPAWDNLLDWYV